MTTAPATTPARKIEFRARDEDRELFALLDLYVNLTVLQIAALTDRDPDNLKHRLVRLTRLGYLDRTPLWRETTKGVSRSFLYRLSKRGVAWARKEGIPCPNAAPNPERSPKLAEHERAISDFHIALTKSGLDIAQWEQRRKVLYQHFSHKGEEYSINPDDFFVVRVAEEEGRAYYGETELSRPHFTNGESAQIRKARAFMHYRNLGLFTAHWKKHGMEIPAFHVLFILTTEERATNLLHALRDAGMGYSMFLVAHAPLVVAQADGAVWRSAKDYDTGVRYSLRD